MTQHAEHELRSNRPRAVLFDLDGTFADTAPDMARAVNTLRAARDLPPLPLSALRSHVSQGARGMIGAGFGIAPEHGDFPALRDAFLDQYERAICVETKLFNGMPQLVGLLEKRDITWGIVTNKASRFTLPLAQALGFDRTAACIVSGDTCARAKPYPDSLLHAAELIGILPQQCLYIGDDERDIQAANAAGMRGIAALYGYLGGSDPATWNAHAAIHSPAEIAGLLWDAA
jgi:phosphoglycolate phosphatase